MTEPLQALLRRQGNDHQALRSRFETSHRHRWHEPGAAPAESTVSVVIPAFNAHHSLPAVLDALACQSLGAEVIVIDDASTDDSAAICTRHPVVTRLLRLPTRMGAASARNLGAALAGQQTIVFLDADMVLPPHVLANLAARATGEAVLIGFRHNIPYGAPLPDAPDLHADHRVRWHPPAGTPLMYSGAILEKPFDGWPLDDTRDLVELGNGRTYHRDWDLPRMVVTALLAVPRHALIDVGGFDPEFGRLGWGMEDTHLGAKLIATGHLVVPLRQAVGFHLDPPDADTLWQAKLASWPATLGHYTSLLEAPLPAHRSDEFTTMTRHLLSRCEVLR